MNGFNGLLVLLIFCCNLVGSGMRLIWFSRLNPLDKLLWWPESIPLKVGLSSILMVVVMLLILILCWSGGLLRNSDEN